jgi:hypothetical protein
MRRILQQLVILVMMLPGVSFAAESYDSSFIENLPALTKNKDDAGLLEWTMQDVDFAAYDKLIVPQPHIILGANNKYKGLQPDQMALLADRLATAFTSRLGDAVDIVSSPSPGTVVMNIAVTELALKKKRGLLSYTPTGALMHAATSNSKVKNLDALAKKIHLKGANLEIELVDATTGDLLAVRILKIGDGKKIKGSESWEITRTEIGELVDRFYTNYTAAIDAASM